MKSESSQSAQEKEAAKAAGIKSGIVFDSSCLASQMPELIEVLEPLELQN